MDQSSLGADEAEGYTSSLPSRGKTTSRQEGHLALTLVLVLTGVPWLCCEDAPRGETECDTVKLFYHTALFLHEMNCK